MLMWRTEQRLRRTDACISKDGYVLDSWNTEPGRHRHRAESGRQPGRQHDRVRQWKEEVKDEKAPTAQISTGGTLQNIDQENPVQYQYQSEVPR